MVAIPQINKGEICVTTIETGNGYDTTNKTRGEICVTTIETGNGCDTTNKTRGDICVTATETGIKLHHQN